MIVISDSRGRHLQEYLPTNRIKVLFYSGASLEGMIRSAKSFCSISPPKYVLVLGGICNMTQKNRRTGEISLRFSHEDALLQHMKDVFTSAWDLARLSFPSSKITFSGLCGADLNRSNGLDGYHPLQPVIDNVISHLNQYIVELNFRFGAYQPKLTSKVHKRSKNHGFRNQYRLLEDGIHPGPIVLKDWSKNIFNLFKLLEDA